ncbi:MAG: hypothetical protein ACK5IJ_07885 [Mangrovibacterium sp.]
MKLVSYLSLRGSWMGANLIPMKKYLLSLLMITMGLYTQAQSTIVLPAYEQGYTKSMNGVWSFRYLPSLELEAEQNFYKEDVSGGEWEDIKVPGNWEMQGFSEPKYGLRLEDGLGLYQRTFSVTQS